MVSFSLFSLLGIACAVAENQSRQRSQRQESKCPESSRKCPAGVRAGLLHPDSPPLPLFSLPCPFPPLQSFLTGIQFPLSSNDPQLESLQACSPAHMHSKANQIKKIAVLFKSLKSVVLVWEPQIFPAKSQFHINRTD